MGRRRLPALAAVLGMFLLGTTVVSPPAARASEFAVAPFQTPHFRAPGYPGFGPMGEPIPRPVLVIYATFDDLPARAGQDAAWLADRFFGPGRDSVNSYFAAVSYGDFGITPARETSGTADDGIVELSFDDYDTHPDGFAQDIEALKAADAYVDFKSYDRSGDGYVTNDELAIHYIRPSLPFTRTDGSAAVEGCGASPSGIDADPVVDDTIHTDDGAQLEEWTRTVSLSVTETNTYTLAHELGHQMFSMPDLYHYGIDDYALSGVSCINDWLSASTQLYKVPNAYERLHLDWGTTELITEDGWYRFGPAATSGLAALIALPGVTNEYFLLENRVRDAATYDTWAPTAKTPLIWHVRDNLYFKDKANGLLNEFVWWDQDNTAALKLDSQGEATMWVRYMRYEGDDLIAFIDIPGDGVIVSNYNEITTVGVGLTTNVPVNVYFTGDSSKDVTFTAIGLPGGWSAQPVTKTLASHTWTQVTVPVTVSVDAPNRTEYTLAIVGQVPGTDRSDEGKTTVRTSYEYSTDITNTSVMLEDPDTAHTFTALVMGRQNEAPVFEAPVTFTLKDLHGQVIWTGDGEVNEDGEASAEAPGLPVGTYSLEVLMEPFHGYRRAELNGLVYTIVNQPPVLAGVSSDLVVEATSAEGAVVGWAPPSATDTKDGAVAVVCAPASGSAFPLGSTAVRCAATDSGGATATGSFTVTVNDESGPVFSGVPDAITAEATGPGGVTVNWPSPTAIDAVDGAVAVTCVPGSGSTFALGRTIVACRAADTRGNSTPARFTVDVVDTTAPAFSGVPADQMLEATGASGAPFGFTVTASDAVSGSRPVSCDHASGTFAMGDTTVTCRATDAAGNEGTASFHVVVRDTTRPVLTLPAQVLVDATGPSGAIATWTATASDVVDGSLGPTCAPASGTLFAVGSTLVTCSIADAAGNRAEGSFTVSVRGPHEQLVALGTKVRALKLAAGLGGALVSQLGAADRMIAKGDIAGAKAQLNDFITTVQAQLAKKIKPADGADLIAAARRILAVIG